MLSEMFAHVLNSVVETDPDPPCPCCDQGEERLAREHTRPLGDQLLTSFVGMVLRCTE